MFVRRGERATAMQRQGVVAGRITRIVATGRDGEQVRLWNIHNLDVGAKGLRRARELLRRDIKADAAAPLQCATCIAGATTSSSRRVSRPNGVVA